MLRTGLGGPLCTKKSRATFCPQSAPEPPLSVMTLCDLPSCGGCQWSPSWTIAKSAVSLLSWFQRTAACCRCIGSSKSRYLPAAAAAKQIYNAKTKYINIVMYNTMQISPRVVMTELIIPPVQSEHCPFSNLRILMYHWWWLCKLCKQITFCKYLVK